MENDRAPAKRLEDNLTRRAEFAKPVPEVAAPSEGKRRFQKARLEAAHWVTRTSFEPQSVCESLQTRRFVFHCCTPYFLNALTHDLDAPSQRGILP